MALPLAAGAKVTLRVQEAPAARLAPQVLAVRAKLAAALPVSVTEVRGSGALPALARLKVWAGAGGTDGSQCRSRPNRG